MSLPFKKLSEEIYSALNASIGVPVYDAVPNDPVGDYVVIGEYEADNDSAKNLEGMLVFPRIEVWSKYKGFGPANDIASLIHTQLTSALPDLTPDFQVMSVEWSDLSPQRREFEGIELRVLLMRFRYQIFEQQ